MYDFAIVALLALANFEARRLLVGCDPAAAQPALAGDVRDRRRRDRAARLLGLPGLRHRDPQRHRRRVGHRLRRGRHDGAVAGAVRLPDARPGRGRRDARRAHAARSAPRSTPTSATVEAEGGATARRPHSRCLLVLQLLELFDAHQHRAGLRSLRRTDHAPALEQIHEAPGAGEADPQLALQHARGTEPARDDELHRLGEQVVGLVGVAACADRPARRCPGRPRRTAARPPGASSARRPCARSPRRPTRPGCDRPGSTTR